MSLWPIAGSFAHEGISPQRSMASVRPSGAARATATSWLTGEDIDVLFGPAQTGSPAGPRTR